MIAQFVSALAPLQVPSFQGDALPNAASYPRCLIYVERSGTEIIALSDGTVWRTVSGQPL